LEGEISFSVAYACSLAIEILKHTDINEINPEGDPVGILCGYDSGDILKLGELTADGMKMNPSSMI
jgi:hypothetical protein